MALLSPGNSSATVGASVGAGGCNGGLSMSIGALSMPGELAGTDADAGSAMLSSVDSPGLKYPSE
eukprot:2748679-Pleurochrysis_carterae.AAC.1